MAAKIEEWALFGWQGVELRVPEVWNLGKVDGTHSSGYARLDDAEIVRMEVEWRQVPRRGRMPIAQLVDRYLAKLEKKAQKAGVEFSVERKAKFLSDKRWLEGSEYETFVWEADYRAYNLARACAHCGRIILLRILARPDESGFDHLASEVFSTLEDHNEDGILHWSLYGLAFDMPEEYRLEKHELKSGNIQLTFEKKKGNTCRIQRLSMAQMLLAGTTLEEWYPNFFKKQLKDLDLEITPEVSVARGHTGLRVHGKPKSRWRQVLRPLPLVNTRPRRYLDGVVWHCPEQNKVCIAEYLHRKKEAGDEEHLTRQLNAGYVCHEEAETESRGDAGLATGAQRASHLGKDG